MPRERIIKTPSEQEIKLLDGSIAISLKTLMDGHEKEHGRYEPWPAKEGKAAITGLIQLLTKRKFLFKQLGDLENLEKEKTRIAKLEYAYIYLNENDSLHRDILDQIVYLFS